MMAWRTWWIGLTCVLISIGADALFLPHQSIWYDEVVQMNGLTLGPAETTRWLADSVQHDFGMAMADDRMPPLSYYAQWLWSRVFGLNEPAIRWFGVTCVALATALVYAGAVRTWGLGTGVAAALLLATSPNVVLLAVEIRAYALLILCSSALFACLVGLAEGSVAARRWWLAGIVLSGIAAMYSHFFGLVAVGGALVAALGLAIRRGDSIVPVFGSGAVVGIASLGLAPFVRASVGISPVQANPSVTQKLMGLVRLGYRLFASPPTAVSRAVVVVAALGFAVGLICAVSRKRQAGLASLGLALALGSGGVVVVLATLAQSSFAASHYNYNSWMLPALALLIASGLAATRRAVRILAGAAVTLLLAANLLSVTQLAIHGASFAHTAVRPLGNLIRRLGPEQVAVVYDATAPGEDRWAIHAPLGFTFGGRIREYQVEAIRPEAAAITLSDFPAHQQEIKLGDLATSTLLVLRTQTLYAADIAARLQGGAVPASDGPVTQALLGSGDWERVEEATFTALCGVDVDVFRRVARP